MMAPPPKETMRFPAFLEGLAVFFVGNVLLFSGLAVGRMLGVS